MWLQAFNNRNAQKCAIAHLIRGIQDFLNSLSREGGGSDRVAPPTVAGVCGGTLSTAGLSRCPRTVLNAQLLLFATCKGEANALRKSRLRDELLLVKAQLRFFGRSPARRPR